MKSLLFATTLAVGTFGNQSFIEQSLKVEKEVTDIYSKPYLKENYFNDASDTLNDRPIIGVLSQPLVDSQKEDARFAGKSSYIQAGYVRFLQAAGARVVPILYGSNFEEISYILDRVNGIFYCGGDAPEAYTIWSQILFEEVKRRNDEGQYYPIWGTCLGFENLNQFVGGHDVLSEHNSHFENLLLEFIVEPSESQLFGPMGDEAYIFEEYEMTLNSHSWGVTPADFEGTELGAFFRPTSISYDDEGEAFVASMEAYNYPFYGVQFHPEKVMATFDFETKANHSERSQYYNRYFADFFIDKTRRNFNQFESFEEEQKWQVENYDMLVMTDPEDKVYVF